MDREFSEPLLNDFEQQTGTRVLAKYDVESTKTVGLVTAIIHERARPRCDVFWNNEILHTLRLEKLGLLDVYVPPVAENWPREFRSSEGHWIGLAARARVLLVNTKLVPREDMPQSVADLADEKWQGRVGMAKPLFGTTATHAAVLFSSWGDARAQEFFRQLKGNVQVLSGNKQVAESVARGQLAFGLTDTDDAIIELDKGHPVEIVYPDQEGEGTLFIPNTLAIVRGSSHPGAARQLLNYLLQPNVERRLAEGASAQFPVNPAVSVRPRVAPEGDVKWMRVDFRAAADTWDRASSFLRDQFATGE